MLKTARGSLPNSTIDASSSGAADSLPLPPTRRVSSIPGTKKISCKAAAFDDVPETVDPVVARPIGHQQPVRAGDADKAGIAAARRGIDAAVGTRCGEHAEWRHRDEIFRVGVDLRTRLRDHARRGFRVNRLKVAGGKIGQGFFSGKNAS